LYERKLGSPNATDCCSIHDTSGWTWTLCVWVRARARLWH
jgi:hypothetical protein